MSHEALREKLADLALGALPRREAAELEAHARECEACRDELAGLRATRALFSSLPPIEAPARGEGVLLAAAREAARHRPPPLLPSWLWGAGLGAVGAAAVVALTLQLREVARPGLGRDGETVLESAGAPAPAAAGSSPASRPALAEAPAAPEEGSRSERTPAPAAAAPEPARRQLAAAPSSQAGTQRAPLPAPGSRAVAKAERSERSRDRAAPPAAPALGRGDAGGASADAQAGAPAAATAAAPGRPVQALEAEARSASPAAAPRAASRVLPDCVPVIRGVLRRDPAGRLLERRRDGSWRGQPLSVLERFAVDGRLDGATLRVGERTIEVTRAEAEAGRLEPLDGVRLAGSAAEAEARAGPAGAGCQW